jgi:cyclophilin family peptidyl-prolyl cis-trans isomerase
MKRRQPTWILFTLVGLLVIGGVWSFAQKRSTPEPKKQVDWQDLVNESDEQSENVEKQTQEETKAMPNVSAPTKKEIEATKAHGKYTAVIETAKGNIEVLLRGDLAPLTVTNFVKLAQAGFYDGLTFHRVEDWVIQGGDPEGTGMGGPGYSIKLEIAKDLSNSRGAIAMARSSDPNSAGSQFYFLKKKADWLDGQYAVFGNVMKGLDVIDKIEIGDVMTKVTIK